MQSPSARVILYCLLVLTSYCWLLASCCFVMLPTLVILLIFRCVTHLNVRNTAEQ